MGFDVENSDLIGGEADLSWNGRWQGQGYVVAVDVDGFGDVADGGHLYALADFYLHVRPMGLTLPPATVIANVPLASMAGVEDPTGEVGVGTPGANAGASRSTPQPAAA